MNAFKSTDNIRAKKRHRVCRMTSLLLVLISLATQACAPRARAGESPSNDGAVGADRAFAEPARGDPPGSRFDLFPLTVGNRWEYRATYRLVPGIPIAATAILTIEGVEQIAGKTYFKAVCIVTGVLKNPTTVSHYRRAADGIWQADLVDGIVTESLLMPVPLKSGAKWTTTMRDEVFFGRVTARQEARLGGDVRCGGSVFRNCIQISSEVDSKVGKVHQDQWLAPGVGVVKQSQHGPFWSMESVLTGFRNADPLNSGKVNAPKIVP